MAIKSVNSKGNQPWIFIGRTDAEAEAPVLWSPYAKTQLTGKYPDAGKDWRQEEKGPAEDKMLRYHHWLNGHELEQTPGDDKGHGSLVCCSQWRHKQSDMTKQLNNNKKRDNVLLIEQLFTHISFALVISGMSGDVTWSLLQVCIYGLMSWLGAPGCCSWLGKVA